MLDNRLAAQRALTATDGQHDSATGLLVRSDGPTIAVTTGGQRIGPTPPLPEMNQPRRVRRRRTRFNTPLLHIAGIKTDSQPKVSQP